MSNRISPNQHAMPKSNSYFAIHIWAKATLLFCPPERLATGRNAKSPEMPNEPSCARYSSVVLPEIKKMNGKVILHGATLKITSLLLYKHV